MNQPNVQRWRELALCAQTEVRADCLTEPLNRREAYGVWGGLSASERKAVLQQRRSGSRRAGRAA